MNDGTSLSITQYIGQLRAGDEFAAQRIWERFYGRLIRLARRRLANAPTKVADWDDVVQEAMAQFFARVQQGQFPRLHDRGDLWQVLARLVNCRVADQKRKQTRQKRGGGRVFTESILKMFVGAGQNPGLDGLVGVQPTPEFADEMFANLSLALGELPTGSHREVALLRLQGYENREIGKRMNCSRSTVTRRLRDIREIWNPEKLA